MNSVDSGGYEGDEQLVGGHSSPSAGKTLPFAALFLLLALAACSPAQFPALTPSQSIPSFTPTHLKPTLISLPSRTPVLPTSVPLTATSRPHPPTPTPTSQPPTPSWPPEGWLFPDAEVVYSPSAVDFDVQAYVDQSGGFLSTYRQYLMISDWTAGAQIIEMVASENSINPRLLLALLEYQSGCVLGAVEDPQAFSTAMGASQALRQDLYGQLVWAVHELSAGYYGWKDGALTEFSLVDGTMVRPDPELNPGSVAILYFFAQLADQQGYQRALDPESGFLALYQRMFGDPWRRAKAVEPLIPAGTQQISLTLPFETGKRWAFTGGPHPAFEGNGPLAALDFAPPTEESGCTTSDDWVVAMADGLVIRSDLGVVLQDLDGDGYEQTGWVLMYLHIETRDRVPVGTVLRAGDRIGHPSCEGGRATGTHVHIARRFNGEWIPADGDLPFVLDGWIAHAGEAPYQGALTRGEEIVTAHQFGSYISRIARDE